MAAVALLAMAAASAAAMPTDAQGSTSANGQVKSLKRRVASLERTVAALQSTPAPGIPATLPPSGPAGGVLQGTYPNPLGLAVGSVGGSEIVDGSVGQAELGSQSVGASQLKSTYERVSSGTDVAGSRFGNATASCNLGDKVLGGGYAWMFDFPGMATVFSTPQASGGGFENPDQWIVRGISGIDNVLFAWAVCERA
jgi:hypothetical protein